VTTCENLVDNALLSVVFFLLHDFRQRAWQVRDLSLSSAEFVLLVFLLPFRVSLCPDDGPSPREAGFVFIWFAAMSPKPRVVIVISFLFVPWFLFT